MIVKRKLKMLTVFLSFKSELLQFNIMVSSDLCILNYEKHMTYKNLFFNILLTVVCNFIQQNVRS